MGELGTPCDNLPSLTTSAGQTTGHVQPAVCSQQLHRLLPPDHQNVTQSHNQTRPANHREQNLSVTITNILSTFFLSFLHPSLSLSLLSFFWQRSSLLLDLIIVLLLLLLLLLLLIIIIIVRNSQ